MSVPGRNKEYITVVFVNWRIVMLLIVEGRTIGNLGAVILFFIDGIESKSRFNKVDADTTSTSCQKLPF